jgi:hypothetical protein
MDYIADARIPMDHASWQRERQRVVLLPKVTQATKKESPFLGCNLCGIQPALGSCKWPQGRQFRLKGLLEAVKQSKNLRDLAC